MPEPTKRELIDAAFRQAAFKVVRLARQTGTPIVVWRDGRVCHLSPDDFPEFAEPERPEPPRPGTPGRGSG